MQRAQLHIQFILLLKVGCGRKTWDTSGLCNCIVALSTLARTPNHFDLPDTMQTVVNNICKSLSDAFCYAVSRLRFFCTYFYLCIRWCALVQVSKVPYTLCLGYGKDADIFWVERVIFLIVHNYNAEHSPAPMLAGDTILHIMSIRKSENLPVKQTFQGHNLEIEEHAEVGLVSGDAKISVSQYLTKSQPGWCF